MRDKGIDKGFIREFNDSDRDKRGWSKGFYGFRKMFRDYLTKLNVPFYDHCCPEAGITNIVSTGFNTETNTIVRWDPDTTAWVAASGTFIPATAQNNIAAGTGGAIIVTNYLTTINTDAGGDAFTLADGTVVGQMKKILLVVDGGGDATITPANLAGGTTITMNDAADYVILQWNGTDWVVIENSGTTIA